jgi:hypothetical protein
MLSEYLLQVAGCQLLVTGNLYPVSGISFASSFPMKRTYHLLLLLLLSVYASSCSSQPSSPFAPESGIYTGGTLNVTANMNYTYNPVTGFGVQPGTSITPGVNVLGDLNITNGGNNAGSYSFSKLNNWKGNWQYDPIKEKLTLTGPLKDALRYYHAGKGSYDISFVIKAKPGDKEGVTYRYSKKASKPFPKPARPNGDLKGSFTVKPDLNTVAFFDAATARISKSFNGKTAITNNKHYTIAIGFTDNTKYYQISIVDPAGNAKMYDPQQIMSYNWNFFGYQFGVINNDQSKMALLGKTPDSYLNLTYKPGYTAVGIFDFSGRTLGILQTEDNNYIMPSFLGDGRLVYCPQKGGIAITNTGYSNSHTVYTKAVNAFAISADDKTIAFSEGIHFYTMNIDGSNKKQVVCDGEPLTADNGGNVINMAWAPDGKQFAVSYKLGSAYGILIVPLDGSNYRFVRDEDGEIYKHAGQIISWH